MFRSCRAVAVLVFLFAAPLSAQRSPELPSDLDRYVNQVMADFDVPGLALAIVKDGRVVLTRGYGVRALGATGRVDEHTLFGIASNTKAFTATALALLVEENKVAWDAPVIRYLPWFRLSNPYVTAELTVRDLLVHRSGLGLGAGDLLWWPPSTYDRKEIAERLQFIPLKTSFRSAYAYDNVLYLIAAQVIEAVSGHSWEDFVTSRIMTPIGMNESNVLQTVPGAGGNVAATHARVEGTVRRIKPFLSANTNPAGGINASAADIAKWMMVQLDSGAVAGGPRLFSAASTRQLWNIVTPISPGRYPTQLEPLSPDFLGYALGFEVREYRGQKLVTHTGGLPGYISRIALLPAQRLGIAVFTNHESPAMEPIVYHLLDHYLGASFDWRAGFKWVAAMQDSATAAADAGAAARRDSTSRPSLALEKYAGTYTDKWYGDVNIASTEGKLEIRFSRSPSLVGDLVHWQYNTFLARWHDRELRADAFVTFALKPDGTIESVKMEPASPSVDFSFDFQDLDLRPTGSAGH